MSDNEKSKYPNNQNTSKSVDTIDSDENFKYVFKKTEKIVQAIYLITNHIKDTEPVKLELRERALALLTISLELNRSDLSFETTFISSFFSSAKGLIPFINLLSISGFISSSNSSLLSGEINRLINFLHQKMQNDLSTSGLILSKDFFNIDDPLMIDKGQKGNQLSVRSNAVSNESRNNLEKQGSLKDKKNSRRQNILDLLAKQSNLTIKDFVKVISDCSEKTIQRELTDLVDKGIIKKDGERRWSTYSLR